MLEMFQSGGWIMYPLLLCSVAALAIAIERFWALRSARIAPKHLVAQAWTWVRKGEMDKDKLARLRAHSPLGELLAPGLASRSQGRDVVKQSISEAGRRVVVEMERFMSTLGTIAMVSPLIGLLGTVIGMIRMFSAASAGGMGNAEALASGIGQALITTAAGLVVAIPATFLYRMLQRRIDELMCALEQEATRMVDAMFHTEHSDAKVSV